MNELVQAARALMQELPQDKRALFQKIILECLVAGQDRPDRALLAYDRYARREAEYKAWLKLAGTPYKSE
jgi:hypothetical protein